MIRAHILFIVLTVLLSAGLLSACGSAPPAASTPGISTPEVPSALNAALFQRPILKARGVGVQIYDCLANPGKTGATQTYAWVLKAPEATLYGEHGAPIGRHYAGPTWELNDGSRVVGMAQATLTAPSGDAIPWLRLAVVKNGGTGSLAAVRAVQRVETVGGTALAAGCDAGTQEREVRVSYEATYYFYIDAS
jgi:Protein of unknown function (DUF3455)